MGSTIVGYLSENKTFKHEVLSLGYTQEYILENINNLKVPYTDHVTHKEIIEKIPEFDIVLIHQWNHPLLYDFLVRNELPPCRMIMWGHNSGFFAPNIFTKKVLMYPDLFVFTTPISYKCKDVQDLSRIFSPTYPGFIEVNIGRHLRRKYLYNIWSTDGVEEYTDIVQKKHKGFIVGYLGTVDYAKLHPDFLNMCKEIISLNIPHIKFVVIGGLREKEIEFEAQVLGIGDKFEFTGYIPKKELREHLKTFDVFGYPLAPYHYGTCDLVLQIAMASGIVPIVFNNKMEKYIIKNNKTGIIVKDKQGYVQAIKDMYNNINWRKELGNNARKEAINNFTLKKLDTEWQRVFNKILNITKNKIKWDINKTRITYADVFLESLGDYAKPFEEDNIKIIRELSKIPSWQTETKGSVHNYSAYFPEDYYLSKWSKIMSDNK